MDDSTLSWQMDFTVRHLPTYQAPCDVVKFEEWKKNVGN